MVHRKDRKARVFWTDEETDQAVREAVNLSFADKEFIWAFVAKGQKVLPQDRQRTITGRAGINAKVTNAFCELRQEILETGVPFEVRIEKEVLVERPRKDILASITTEELIGLLAARLAPIVDLIPALLTKVSERTARPRETTPNFGGTALPPAPETSMRRYPRVLLYGFLPRQEKDILEKVKGFKLELMFQKKEKRNFEPPPSCQWCIVINKIKHPAWDKLKVNFGDRIRLVEGVTQALQALADINSLVGAGMR